MSIWSHPEEIKKKGSRRADQKRTPRHRAIRAEPHNLKPSPSRGSQGEKFRASANERKVIIKRDLKLAISSWRLGTLVPWLQSSPNCRATVILGVVLFEFGLTDWSDAPDGFMG
jgi:hypothetical protein